MCSSDLTDNPLDFALQGENLYFAIQTPYGVRYTRDGSFTINGAGMLTTREGYQVLSREGIDGEGGMIIPQGSNLESDKNGNVYIRELANDTVGESAQIGSLAVASFENPRYLKKVGNNLYEFPEDRLNERSVLIDSNSVISGFVEKSNVNAVIEMSGLIETNRLVDIYSKVLKTHMDDLNTEAITKLAVRA